MNRFSIFCNARHLIESVRALRRCALLAAVVLSAGCAVAPPRTDDPLQKINRKTYAFNNTIDEAVIRPVAAGYRKVTNPTSRELISNFFSNTHLSITITNDVLQAHPLFALETTGRLAVNSTVGILGFFDPASELKLPLGETDFGVTLARWGVPEGPFIVVPFVGPSTVRDIFSRAVDSYFFDPLSYYGRASDAHWYVRYAPQGFYLITLRAGFLDSESFLKAAYDPYIFERDAYRQRRIYEIYRGNPPAPVIERLQGVNDNGDDIDQLLEQQHAYEREQRIKPDGDGNTPPTKPGHPSESHPEYN